MAQVSSIGACNPSPKIMSLNAERSSSPKSAGNPSSPSSSEQQQLSPELAQQLLLSTLVAATDASNLVANNLSSSTLQMIQEEQNEVAMHSSGSMSPTSLYASTPRMNHRASFSVAYPTTSSYHQQQSYQLPQSSHRRSSISIPSASLLQQQQHHQHQELFIQNSRNLYNLYFAQQLNYQLATSGATLGNQQTMQTTAIHGDVCAGARSEDVAGSSSSTATATTNESEN